MNTLCWRSGCRTIPCVGVRTVYSTAYRSNHSHNTRGLSTDCIYRYQNKSTMSVTTEKTPRFIDVGTPFPSSIGINLTDPIFRGRYHGVQRHPDDLQDVINRADEIGCTKMIITGSDVANSKHALSLIASYKDRLYSTVGIHPCSSRVFGVKQNEVTTSSSEIEDENQGSGHCIPCEKPQDLPEVPSAVPPCSTRTQKQIDGMREIVEGARAKGGAGLVALGEFGLDYDRLYHCPAGLQRHAFDEQLELAASLQPQLPLFLHSRAAHRDFVALLQKHFGSKLERLEKGGVVHSFTGSLEEMRELVSLGLYIGVNGCSLKTEENCEVVKEIPLDHLMLETDGPWCEVRPSHAGYRYLVAAHEARRAKPKSEAPASASAEEKDSSSNAPTPTPEAAGQHQKSGGKKKKNAKNAAPEPVLIERFKSVKKEKWVQGALIKGRNEPCLIERVADIVAGIKDLPMETVSEAAWNNTVKVFGL